MNEVSIIGLDLAHTRAQEEFRMTTSSMPKASAPFRNKTVRNGKLINDAFFG